MYPTAGKLAAALLFAALAWTASGFVEANLPAQRPPGWFSEVNAVLGFCLGWRILGRHAGRGVALASGAALSAGVAMVLAALALWALAEMTRRAMTGRYAGPVEALEQAIGLAVDYAQYLGPGDVPILLLAGSLGAGILAELVARRYP